MPIGAAFPPVDTGADPGAIRAYVEAMEEFGYDHIVMFDHVLNPNTEARQTRRRVYGPANMFHEVFVMLGYVAGITQRLGLATGILILPQRQTVLVAKQVAEIDVLSRGRMRLGIATGWNRVEYEGLGADWEGRGERSEEQIAVLRELWTKDLVTFDGRWHTIGNAGLNPLPVQRPVPIWLGGAADAVLQRIARIGDGGFINSNRYSPETVKPQVDKLNAYIDEMKRDPATVGMEAWVLLKDSGPDDWLKEAEGWKDVGATHITANTNGTGVAFPDGHIDLIKSFKEALGGLAI